MKRRYSGTFDIHTNYHISAHHPNIVIVDNNSHSAVLVDGAVSADANIISKEK